MPSRLERLQWIIQATALTIALSGCASSDLITPDYEYLSSDEAAILKVDRTFEKTAISGGRASLNALIRTGGQIVLNGGTSQDYYRVKVAPGYYTVMLKVYPNCNCLPVYLPIQLQTRAGMTYLFTSTLIMGRKGVQAEYKEISTPSDTTPDY